MLHSYIKTGYCWKGYLGNQDKNTGFGFVCVSQDDGDVPQFVYMFNQRTEDCGKQGIIGNINDSSRLLHYKRVKSLLDVEYYITSLNTREDTRSLWVLRIHELHLLNSVRREREMFYLTTHSTHFIYGYMASDIWLRTILIVRKETRCRHIGYSYRLTARVLLYAPSHRQDNTYRGALAGTRNSSMGPPHEGSIRRPIAP